MYFNNIKADNPASCKEFLWSWATKSLVVLVVTQGFQHIILHLISFIYFIWKLFFTEGTKEE